MLQMARRNVSLAMLASFPVSMAAAASHVGVTSILCQAIQYAHLAHQVQCPPLKTVLV